MTRYPLRRYSLEHPVQTLFFRTSGALYQVSASSLPCFAPKSIPKVRQRQDTSSRLTPEASPKLNEPAHLYPLTPDHTLRNISTEIQRSIAYVARPFLTRLFPAINATIANPRNVKLPRDFASGPSRIFHSRVYPPDVR